MDKPTGSKDPYALRRAALGVIRLVLENKVRFGSDAFYHALREGLLWPAMRRVMVHYVGDDPEMIASKRVIQDLALPVPAAASWDRGGITLISDRPMEGWGRSWSVPAEILAFFAERLKIVLRDEGKRHDLVDAVFALGDDDLVRIVARVEALSGFLATEDGANLLAGYKRAVNILRAEAKKHPEERVSPLPLDGGEAG